MTSGSRSSTVDCARAGLAAATAQTRAMKRRSNDTLMAHGNMSLRSVLLRNCGMLLCMLNSRAEERQKLRNPARVRGPGGRRHEISVGDRGVDADLREARPSELH